jgi:hypothetical protein
VTNDIASVDEFIADVRRTGNDLVYKHAASGTMIGMPTRRLIPRDIPRLSSVNYSHVIFQEMIRGIDLRIAVLGERVFCCEWRGEQVNLDASDIRMVTGTRMWQGDMPLGLRSRLLALHTALGLTFGVYDFKVDEHGQSFFLEVNPSGQWLDMEFEGQQCISEAWARVLVEGVTSAVLEPTLPPLTEQQLEDIGRVDKPPVPEKWNRVI